MDPATRTDRFRTCLLVASPDVDTLPLVRALHGAGLAVLERLGSPATLTLALSHEFDLVAWVWTAGSAADRDALERIAAARIGLIALVREVTAEAATECLVCGADACLQIDADARLVAAQAHAVLRRHAPASQEGMAQPGLLKVGDLCVDVDRCEVERAGEIIALTAAEFRIVEYMARYPGRVLKPCEILNAVSDDYEYLPREAQEVFKVYVRRIRRKLEPVEDEPRYLITARGFGYRLEGGGAPSSRRIPAEQTA